jgi:hypothetical protein
VRNLIEKQQNVSNLLTFIESFYMEFLNLQVTSLTNPPHPSSTHNCRDYLYLEIFLTAPRAPRTFVIIHETSFFGPAKLLTSACQKVIEAENKNRVSISTSPRLRHFRKQLKFSRCCSGSEENCGMPERKYLKNSK